MLSFASDYLEGAHEAILKRFMETNFTVQAGYGNDEYTYSAIRKIRQACDAPKASVYLISGGTQTNKIVIAAMLHATEGVVAAETGHINVHEAGAIESTGHKVLTVPGYEGKVQAERVEKLLRAFWSDETQTHMVYPGMLYISQPTEYGTLYKRDEIQALSDVCRRFGMKFYVDGARLGYALGSVENDVTLADLATYCDAFYIGGTKVGALCGEAVVFPKEKPYRFETVLKQLGGLMAKGRILGIQFDTLFTDNLYSELGKHAVKMANQLKKGLKEQGHRFYVDSPTNQQFIIMKDVDLLKLREKVGYSYWQPGEADESVIRFATSWATTEDQVEALLRILKQ